MRWDVNGKYKCMNEHEHNTVDNRQEAKNKATDCTMHTTDLNLSTKQLWLLIPPRIPAGFPR